MRKTVRGLWVKFCQGAEELGRDFYVSPTMVGLCGMSRFVTTVDDLRKEFGDGKNLRDLYLPKSKDDDVTSIINAVGSVEDLMRCDLLDLILESEVRLSITHVSGDNKFTASLTRIHGKEVEFGERNFDPTLIKSWGDVIDLILLGEEDPEN